jgi:hypothetical protein
MSAKVSPQSEKTQGTSFIESYTPKIFKCSKFASFTACWHFQIILHQRVTFCLLCQTKNQKSVQKCSNGLKRPRVPVCFKSGTLGGFRILLLLTHTKAVPWAGYQKGTVLNNNKIIRWDSYLLSLIEELQDWLSIVKWFMTLNLKEAYYWVRMKKDKEWKMTS